MPGFNDAHLHLASGGFQTDERRPAWARGRWQEMQQRIALTGEDGRSRTSGSWAAAGTTPCGRTQKLPTRQDIDAVTNGHPAIFVRVDGHIAVANTAALKAAGITGKTPALRKAARSTSTPMASHRDSARDGQRLVIRQGASADAGAAPPRPRNWLWPTPRAGASPRRRTTPSGRSSWFTKSWSAKAS